MIKRTSKAQVLIEFTFAMVIIFLMIYGSIMIFRWSGMDLAEKRIQHEEVLTGTVGFQEFDHPKDALPMRQIDPQFYKPIEMNAVFGE